MKNWASKSLEERVRLFRSRYPNTRMSAYKLKKLYVKHGIRKKVIKIGKIPAPPNLFDQVLQAADLR